MTLDPVGSSANLRRHIPTLDGVRGVAILLVMLHHFTLYGDLQPVGVADKLFYRVAYAGWSGVDLFFVLSGFLITGILFDTREQEHFFRNFYMRRVLRIFPLYYGCLAVVFWVIPALWPINSAYRAFLQDQPWYWSYLANIHIALNNWPKFFAVSHFWSLAIEEQFYLLWPIIVYRFRHRTLMLIAIGAILASPLIRFGLGLAGYRLAAYMLTPARMDALAIGALLALVLRAPTLSLQLVRRAWPVAALLAAAISILFVRKGRLDPGDGSVYTIGFSLLALFFAAVVLIAVAAADGTPTRRFFASPVLRFFGRYSYALYVFHQPVALYLASAGISAQIAPAAFGSRLPGLAIFSAIAACISVALALASWYLLESHFLALKRFFDYRSMPRVKAPGRAYPSYSQE